MLRQSFPSRIAQVIHAALAAAGLTCLVLQPQAARAWGNEGHRMINRLAASSLPADVPAFLRSEAAANEIEYLGPEPDRWRSSAEPELSAAQAPEHFIDLEPADALGPMPRHRLDFEAKVFASGQRPEKIGLQPWEATEVWERLKAALREYRRLAAAGQDTRGVEAAAIHAGGWATTWATARSLCTPPSATTAGRGRIPTAIRRSTRFIGNSRGRSWPRICTSPKCAPR